MIYLYMKHGDFTVRKLLVDQQIIQSSSKTLGIPAEKRCAPPVTAKVFPLPPGLRSKYAHPSAISMKCTYGVPPKISSNYIITVALTI